LREFDALQAAVGPGVTIVDPSPAIAQQTARVLAGRAALAAGDGPGEVIYCTSGDVAAFRRTLRALLGVEAEVRAARWDGDRLAAGRAGPTRQT